MRNQNLPPRTKLKDSERSKRVILQAALEEFADSGFKGATVRAIAARIDLSHAMIRYHYETKEKLWFAAVDFLFERANIELTLPEDDLQRLRDGDLDVYRDLLRSAVRYGAKYPEHTRIVVQEATSASPRLDYYVREHVRSYLSHFELTLNILKDLGCVSPSISTPSYYYMLTGAVQNRFTMAEEAHRGFDVPAISEEAIDEHINAVISIFCPYE